MATRDITVRFRGDTSDLARKSKEAEGSVGKVSGAVKGLAAGAAIGGAAIAVGFGKQAVDAASRLEQSVGAVKSVFGEYAGEVERASGTAADRLGLAKSSYGELASTLGAQLQTLGFAAGDSATLTDDLVAKGADLAATFGGPTSDAVAAIGSLMRGEADPIERYGVGIKAADVAGRLAAKGLDKLTGPALKQAQAQEMLAMLTEQTAGAQGAFARESDTAAGAQARASAKFEDAKAAIGARLLPAVTKLTQWAAEKLIPALLRLGPVLDSVGRWFTTVLVPAVQSAVENFRAGWAIVSTAVVPVLQAIGSAIATFVEFALGLWSRFGDVVVRYATSAFAALRRIVEGALAVVRGIFDGAWAQVRAVATVAFRLLKEAVSRGLDAVVGFVRGLPQRAVNALAALAGLLKGAGSAALRAMKDGAVAGYVALRDWLAGLPQRIFEGAGNLKRKGIELAEALIRGLVQAVRDGAAAVINAVKDLGGAVIDKAKSVFGIGSPSKVFATIGAQLVDGMTLGIDRKAADARAALTAPLRAGLRDAARLSGGGAGLTVGGSFRAVTPAVAAAGAGSGPVNITVQVPPTVDPATVGRQVVDAIRAYERTAGTGWRVA